MLGTTILFFPLGHVTHVIRMLFWMGRLTYCRHPSFVASDASKHNASFGGVAMKRRNSRWRRTPHFVPQHCMPKSSFRSCVPVMRLERCVRFRARTGAGHPLFTLCIDMRFGSIFIRVFSRRIARHEVLLLSINS